MSAVIRTITAGAVAALCFASIASAATRPTPVPCAHGLDVPITVYNQSYLTGSELNAIVDTARNLWHPYGVTLAPVREHGVSVIVSHRSLEADGSQGRMTLGTTMFSNGHAIPYIHLWVGAAESLLYAAASTHVWSMPTDERDSMLLPMLGAALAHELGHLLLDTSTHALGGMLQRIIPVSDLRHPTPERLGLSTEQQSVLCALKESRVPVLQK